MTQRNTEADYVSNIEKLTKQNKSLGTNIQTVFLERDKIQSELHKKNKVEFDQCEKVNDKVSRLVDEIKVLNEEKNQDRKQVEESCKIKEKLKNMKIMYKQKEIEINGLKDELRRKETLLQQSNGKIDKLTFELMHNKTEGKSEWNKLI